MPREEVEVKAHRMFLNVTEVIQANGVLLLKIMMKTNHSL